MGLSKQLGNDEKSLNSATCRPSICYMYMFYVCVTIGKDENSFNSMTMRPSLSKSKDGKSESINDGGLVGTIGWQVMVYSIHMYFMYT